jgi:hypothetical protein
MPSIRRRPTKARRRRPTWTTAEPRRVGPIADALGRAAAAREAALAGACRRNRDLPKGGRLPAGARARTGETVSEPSASGVRTRRELLMRMLPTIPIPARRERFGADRRASFELRRASRIAGIVRCCRFAREIAPRAAVRSADLVGTARGNPPRYRNAR